jgi:hypothetical protein
MITTKYISFFTLGILLVFAWMISALLFEYLQLEVSNRLLGISETDTDNVTIGTLEKNTSISVAKNNGTSTNMTLTIPNDVNGSLTTLTPGGPQGLEDRRHAPS